MVQERAYPYVHEFTSADGMAAFAERVRAQSDIISPVEPAPGDRVLTLCTCTSKTNDLRYVVCAKLIPRWRKESRKAPFRGRERRAAACAGKTERQGTEAERQLAWSREYLRREKRRRVLRRTLLMLVLALACAVTVFALNGGIPALRVGGAPASGSSAAQSSSAPAVQAQPPSSQAQPEPVAYTVAFDSRGGSAVEALQNVTQGAHRRAVVSGAEGYTFEGWYRDAARTDAWDFAADTVEQDTILYAKWEAVPAQDTTSGAALPPDGRGHGRIAVGVRAGCGACAGRGGSLLLLRRAYRG